jgi:spore maturation protein CgeB
MFVDNAYDPATHRPLELSDEDAARYGAEIGFVGAYEEDRARHLLHLAHAGLSVTVWGPGWTRFHESHPNLLIKERSAFGVEYTKVLNATKINLCFLRKLNRDLQTTRSVEIPACSAFMLAERTGEHQRLLTEGVEVEYFEGVEELEQKCRQYLADDSARNAIARRARERCLADGYSNGARLKGVLSAIAEEHQAVQRELERPSQGRVKGGTGLY